RLAEHRASGLGHALCRPVRAPAHLRGRRVAGRCRPLRQVPAVQVPPPRRRARSRLHARRRSRRDARVAAPGSMIARLGPPLLVRAVASRSAAADPAPEGYPLDVHKGRVIDSESGPVNYYRVVEDPAGAFIRAAYRPPMETTVLGVEAPENVRDTARKLRWSWRAMELPTSGATCGTAPDAAATVYVSWKRGLRWCVLKYVWATAVPKGSICER